MTTPAPNPVGVGLAILMMLAAYLLFSLTDSTTKWLALAGIPALQLAFVRYCVQSGMATLYVLRSGITAQERTHTKILFLRAAFLTTSTVSNFIAVRYLDLSVYGAIMFSSPFFVSMLSWPVLGERVGPWRWFAICMGFVGVLIILRPFNDDYHWSALCTLYAAFGTGVYSLLTRKLSPHVRAHVMQFYAGTIGAVVLLPLGVWVWVPVGWEQFGLMLWVGFASWGAHEILTRAHKHAPASVLMPYSYSFIIYLTIVGYFMFNEVPDMLTIIGALVIFVSGLVIWQREKRLQKNLRKPLHP